MCETAGKNTTKHALGIVGRIVRNGAEVSGGEEHENDWKEDKKMETYRASHFPEGAKCDMVGKVKV